MYRWITALVFVFLGAGSIPAGEPIGKVIVECWDALYLEGGRAGHVVTTVVELEQKGQKTLRTTVDMRFLVKRNNQAVRIEAQNGTDETPEGQVDGTFLRHVLGVSKEMVIVGVVKGKQLEFIQDGKTDVMKPAPWDSGVIGLYRQQSLMADKKVKPGDKFTFPSFESSVNLVVKMDVEVKEREWVELMGQKKASLLRVEITPQKIQGVALPKLVMWLDETWKPVRQDTEIPGLGRITMYRTTREIALAPGPLATTTDIGISQVIRLNKKLARPYESTSGIYRITVKGDEDAASAFSQDPRQRVVNAKGSTFELHINTGKSSKKTVPSTKPGDEFMESSYFITAGDPQVKLLARKAVGKEKDDWKKALLIEKWVHANMRSTNDEALATADHVARTLQGDCTEYAMLMAAMCRAEGVPSKTAIGLIYADTPTGPVLAFHMWTEVWIAGAWVPLDATLGRGHVGATHLKVTDHSWHDTRALTPLLPLMRVLGKTQVEVISVQ